MSRARHRRVRGAYGAIRARVVITAFAAVVVGALGASSLWVAGDSRQATGRLAANTLSASSPAAPYQLPAASPAEGHSPQLLHDLAGPLTGTGKVRPGLAVPKSQAKPEASAAAASSMLNGIDVASFQHPNGAAINWADVAAAGYQFAAVKATEGTYYTNSYYVGDAQAATAAGMYVSAYHFANPYDSTGTAQADYAAQNAGMAQNAANATYKVGGHYLPLMLDLEYNPYPADGNECYGLSAAQMVSWISDFMTEAKTLTGAAPIIYTPLAWWDTCTGNSTAFRGDLLWVPAYSAGTPGTLPAGWNTWTMWQYTSAGSVPGISGTVDLDYFSGGPQGEQTVANAPASVQIETLNALAGQQVSYSASGLPPAMTMSSAGLITGNATAGGAYQVTVTASSSSAVLPGTVSFTWNVDQPSAAPAAFNPLSGDQDFYGSNGAEYKNSRRPAGGWSGWANMGGSIASSSSALYDPARGTMEVYARSSSQEVENDFWIASTGTWSGWQSLNGATLDAPAAVYYPPSNALEVYVTGTNRSPYVDSWTSAGGRTGFKNMGGTFISGPAAVYDPATGSIKVFGVGTTHSMYVNSWTSAGGWTGWTGLGGTLKGSAPVVIYDPASGNLEVYAWSTSGSAQEDYWTASTSKWSGWTSLGGILTSAPAAVYDPTAGSVRVFGVGSTSAVYVDSWTPGSGWSGWKNLGGDMSGILAAAYDPASRNLEVYGRYTNGTPHVDSWNPSQGWAGWTSLSGILGYL